MVYVILLLKVDNEFLNDDHLDLVLSLKFYYLKLFIDCL